MMSTRIDLHARRRALAMVVLAIAVTTFQLVVRPAPRASATVASPAYTIEDLGVFTDGGTAAFATGINAAGDVSGFANHDNASYTAFRWSNGTLTDLGDLGCGAHGNAINDSGTVVGFSNVSCAESDKAGFQTSSSGIADIGNFAGGSRPTVAYAINAAGQIVGSSETEHGTGRAFITGPGGTGGLQQVDLLATSEPDGAQTLEAHGVNAEGDVVGIAFFFDQTCGSHDNPFLFSGGTLQELTGLGACGGQANAINDAGVVVGFSGSLAFKWDGTIHDLGLPTGTSISQALAINNGGTIVGAAYASQLSPPQAWINGSGGGTRLLNDLIDPASGWNLGVATGINDSGQIVGYGSRNGLNHAFRLTPVAAKTLASIAVTPASPTISAGASQQFTATGTYSDSSTADLTGSVVWSSSKPKVASISSGGLLSTHARGATVVTATMGSISGTASVTVGPVALVSVAISPANPTIAVGATQQFVGTGTYSNGKTRDLTTKGKWVSSTKSVATIDAHTGLATAKINGSSTITFHMGTANATTTLSVGSVATA